MVASAIAVLALLFGMQFLYARQTFAVPLATKLQDVPGVMGAPRITRSGANLDVDVQLGLVKDLQTTYQSLQQAATSAAAGRPVALHVKDNSTPALVADYEALGAIIAQGRKSGQYEAMQQQFLAKTVTLGFNATQAIVTVSNSENRIFVELVNGSHYLYRILPLTLPSSASGGAA